MDRLFFLLLFLPLCAASATWAQNEEPAAASPIANPPPSIDPVTAVESDETKPKEDGADDDARSRNAPVTLSDEQRFEQGATLFELGDCESVINVLGDFSLGGAGRDEVRLVEAHRMLGVCFFQRGRRSEAERELKQLLYLNPDYELDPFLTPPPVVQLYDELKIELAKKLEEIRGARDKRKNENAQGGPAKTVVIEIEREVRTSSWVSTLVPFGGGQYANQEPVKAVGFFAAQSASIGLGVLLFGALQLFQPEGLLIGEFPQYIFRGEVDADGFFPSPVRPTGAPIGEPILAIGDLQQPVATVLWLGQGVALLVIAGVYSAGVADAWLSREEEVLVSESRHELPAVPAASDNTGSE